MDECLSCYLDVGHWFAWLGGIAMSRMEPFTYPEILYNEAIYWLGQKWGRMLTPHEMHIAIEIYRFARTVEAENEIRILEVVR